MQIDRAFMCACFAACNSGRIAENNQIKKIYPESLAGFDRLQGLSFCPFRRAPGAFYDRT